MLAGKVPASVVLHAAGIVEALRGELLAEGFRLRFFEVGSNDALTVRNDRLACTAKKIMQLREAQPKMRDGRKEWAKACTNE